MSKVKNNPKTIAIKASIVGKIAKGDFIMLSKVLELPYETVKQRFRRNDYQAVFYMAKIILHKDRMIANIKSQIEATGKKVISIKTNKNKKGAIVVAPKVNN